MINKTQKRKIIIDAGAHIGQSIDRLREKFKNEDVEIYSFEPHPRCFLEAKKRENKSIKVFNKAVWIEDGTVDFYCDSLDVNTSRPLPGQASTIFEAKTKRSTFPGQFDERSKITALSFDFSKWIKENFSKDDFIHVKMDIEGAEYQVLKKMEKDSTISFLNELDVEFHWEKIGMPKNDHDEIVEMLSKFDIKVTIH
jgi:FkbM family methyltransferase